MEKSGVKSSEMEGGGEGKTAKMTDLAEVRPVGTKSGIYMVKSERMRTVGFFTSYNYGIRVRKLRSDYRRGERRNLLERMGLVFAGDVVFEEVELCPPELFGIRTRRLVEEWISKGYQVYGWTGEKGEAKADEWGPCGRLREIAGKHGMTEAEVIELLDQMDTVLGPGAGAHQDGRD